ncbi:hypothetical protein V6N13_005354 [Hibiscus sabdariffa]
MEPRRYRENSWWFRENPRRLNQAVGGGRHVVTLFVQNIPTTLHWSGLRQTFGRHGDVIDSFIARKWDKAGMRFGFVRFSNRTDAERAIERLNGFNLYGFRLSVSLAKYNVRTAYWRKSKQRNRHYDLKNETRKGSHNQTEGLKDNKGPNEAMVRSSGREPESSEEKSLRRILGHVEEEALWKLNKCAIGKMATVCSSNSVEERLHGWGLGEINVKSMGGRWFLIEFKDQELFQFLKEQDWSYLKEVFSEVEPWTESFHLPERITWIQAEGIPLHCWNHTTFKRLAESWGSLIALGENASQLLDDTDVKKRLAIPAKILPSLPGFSESSHAVNINLVYGTRKWPLVCTVRKKGYKKPVFSSRLRTDFVICNNLNVGDGISMFKVEDEDGSSYNRVEVEKQDETIVPCRRKVCNATTSKSNRMRRLMHHRSNRRRLPVMKRLITRPKWPMAQEMMMEQHVARLVLIKGLAWTWFSDNPNKNHGRIEGQTIDIKSKNTFNI